MRRGISRGLVPALLLLLGACATEGIQNHQFDANPVHAPGLEQVGDTYDAVNAGAAEVAAGVVDGLLTPIKVLFDTLEEATAPYPSTQVAPDPSAGMSPEERQGWRRQQMGLPEPAEARIAARRSQLRNQMALQSQPK